MSKIKGISHITFICKDLERITRMLKNIFEAVEIKEKGMKNWDRSLLTAMELEITK